jgi:outer membrane protein assembly factor BamB
MNYFLRNSLFLTKKNKISVIPYFIAVNIYLILTVFIYSQDIDVKIINEVKISGLSSYSVATDGISTLYLPLEKGKIMALQNTGEILWESDLGGDIYSDLYFFNDKLFFILQKEINNNLLICISAKTGLVSWQSEVNASDNAKILKNSNNLTLINKNNIEYFNLNDGKKNTENTINPNTVLTKDFRTIKLKNSFEFENYYQTDDDIFILATPKGLIYFYDFYKNKLLWNKNLGGKIIDVINLQNDLLIASNDNYLYSYKKKNGKLRWKTRFQTNINPKILYFDSKLILFSNYYNNFIHFVEQRKGNIVKEYQVCEDCFLTKNPERIGDIFFLQTSNSIILFYVKKAG